MKKVVLVVVAFLFAGSLWAGSKSEKIRNLYAVVAPTIYGEIAEGNKVLGQIYYDAQDNSYKGIALEGNSIFLSAENYGYIMKRDVDGVTFDGSGYADITYDTNGGDSPGGTYFGGIYTVPYSRGNVYFISASALIGGTFTAGDTVVIMVKVNGTVTQQMAYEVAASTSQFQATIHTAVTVGAGDQVSIAVQTNGVPDPASITGATSNWLLIHELLH